jgi:hypothetical protein
MTESQLKQDLRAMLALYSEPENWTQGTYARDHQGNPKSPESEEACSWCLSGAGYCVPGDPWPRIAFLRSLIGGPLTNWNDAPERTFEDVIALLDKAIEAAP